MIVVSNGFQKFHMAALAAELDRLGKLTMLLTGTYPTATVAALLKGLEFLGIRGGSRLLARGERMTEARVSSHWIGESVYQLGWRFTSETVRSRLMAAGMSLYASSTARVLRRLGRRRLMVFHYRSGFGGEAVHVAQRLGILTVCDHSIVHPAFINALVRDGGRFDPRSTDNEYDPFWNRIAKDCEASDAVLVNSEFVRSTFLAAGVAPSRVHTIYLGVDDSFLKAIPEVDRRPHVGARPLKMLFAASVCDRRKGTHDLLEACRRLSGIPLQLRIAGIMPGDMRREFRDVLEQPDVHVLGVLSRKDLAQEMASADIFVFPSLAEGSARVIFEAMACGCYIITTPNSGSIVENGVHGELTPPGDPGSIVAAISRAATCLERVREIGRRNASLVRNNYLQEHYGTAVLTLYKRLLEERTACAS